MTSEESSRNPHPEMSFCHAICSSQPANPSRRLKGVVAALVIGEVQVVPEDHRVDDGFQQWRIELFPVSNWVGI